MTLRDELAAVLGPGNDDATAYHQADAILDILLPMNKDDIIYQLAISVQDREYGPYAPDGPTALERWLQDRA